MEKVYFTVGPSQVYPTIYRHFQEALKEDIPSLNHRGGEFKKLFENTQDNLKKLLNIPKNYPIFFVSSALESMERTIQNCVEKTSFHIITGSFGKAWANYATLLGKNAIKCEAERGEGVELANLKVPQEAELICIVQNDTSTGVFTPMEDIYKLKKKYPGKLIAIDVVSSIPYVDINFKYIDVAFFSVQKGFGLPAGLGIMIVSPKALGKCEGLIKKGIVVGSYHSFKSLAERAGDFQTPETPNIVNIYLLNKVTGDMLKKGISKIRQETDEKAQAIYDFLDHHPRFSPFIKNPKFRSKTTLVFNADGGSEAIRKRLAKKGFIVGAGYGDDKLNHLRIANFPAHKLQDIKTMLKFI